MKTQNLIPMMIAAALVMAAAQPAHALSMPDLNIAAGTTLGANGTPADGGASITLSPMWPISDHARFGISMFADDIGSDVGHMYDPNDNTDLGLTSFGHRWTWGAAWRGDMDVARVGRWSALASGTWGWSRIEDDLRGHPYAAASAVGVGLGAGFRRPVGASQTLGLIVRGQRLYAQRNASYRRVTRYVSAALEWRWAGASRP